MEEKNDELIEIETDFGFGILPREIMRSSLSTTAKAIYAYLASFAGNTRKAFPSVRLICNELGMSENTFYKYLKELKDLGVVEIIKEREQGKFTKNIYKLSPYLKLSCMAEPYTVNLGTNNNNIINNNNSNNIKEKINKKEKYFEDEELNKKYHEYLQMRIEKKCKATPTTIKNQVNRLNKYDKGTALQMIQNSIDNGWRGIFEIKNGTNIKEIEKPFWEEKEIKTSTGGNKEIDEILKMFN